MIPDWIEWLENRKDLLYPLCKTIKDKIRTYIANHFITDTVVKTDVRSIVHAMEEGVRLGKEGRKWSEKDSFILNNIIGFIKENTIIPNRHACAEECLEWLESLNTIDQSGLEIIESEIKRLHDVVKKKKEEYERYEIWGEVPELRGKLKAYEELYSFISNIKK